MNRFILKSATLVGGALALAGCFHVAPFNLASPSEKSIPKASDVIDHVQCEIWQAIHDNVDHALDEMNKNEYVVYVSLTLEVTDTEGLAPNLAFIHPYSTATENFTAGLNAQLSGTQDRTFTQSFTLNLNPNIATPGAVTNCKEASLIAGDLGISQIMVEGLKHEDSKKFVFAPIVPIIQNNNNQYMYQNNTLYPSFGSTIDFTVVYGLGGAPQWTLTKFTGPSGSTGGSLISANRTRKDTLILSFAPVGQPNPPKQAADLPTAAEAHAAKALGTEKPKPVSDLDEAEAEAQQNAGQAALLNATQQILQRIFH